MTEYLPWIVDGVCLVILIAGFREGWVKGFASMLLRFFSWLIAALVTFFLYKHLAALLGRIGITAAIASRIKEAIPSIQGGSTSLPALLQTIRVPQFLESALKLNDTPDMYAALGVNESLDYMVQYISNAIVNAASIIVLFVVTLILVRFLAKELKFVNKIPIVGKANALLGGVLNLAVAIMFVCFLLLSITTVGTGREALAPLIEAIDKSMIMALLQKISILNNWIVNIS